MCMRRCGPCLFRWRNGSTDTEDGEVEEEHLLFCKEQQAFWNTVESQYYAADKTPTKGDLEEVGIEKNEGDISSNDKPTLALRSRQRVESSHETNMPDEQDTNKTSAPSAALPQNSKATRARKRSKIIIDKESQASPVTDNEVNPTPSIE